MSSCIVKVVLSFKCGDQILKYGHSNENYVYGVVPSCGAVYRVAQVGSNF